MHWNCNASTLNVLRQRWGSGSYFASSFIRWTEKNPKREKPNGENPNGEKPNRRKSQSEKIPIGENPNNMTAYCYKFWYILNIHLQTYMKIEIVYLIIWVVILWNTALTENIDYSIIQATEATLVIPHKTLKWTHILHHLIAISFELFCIAKHGSEYTHVTSSLNCNLNNDSLTPVWLWTVDWTHFIALHGYLNCIQK